MRKPKTIIIIGGLALFLLVLGFLYWVLSQPHSSTPSFNGQRAYDDVKFQVSLGPRVPGSPPHGQFIEWVTKNFSSSAWRVKIQESESMGHPVKNIIASRGQGVPWIIIAAHYDSRMFADQDPDPAKQKQPVPAANDGASGVAILMELARSLPKDLNKQIWFVLFDTEDQGNFPGWDWILGSRAFADKLDNKPDAVIIIDMIGDADLNIYQEKNSNPELNRQIWKQASQLGYSKYFIPKYKFSMLDDHTPFLEKGIPAIDIIDFDYPYWHTTSDTSDKVSSQSLSIVGNTLLQWLLTH